MRIFVVKRWGELNFGIAFAVCLTIALFALRDPDFFQHPDFWAEDGTEFFNQWYAHGWLSFIYPYAGYLHLIPRTAAALTSLFPMTYAAVVFSGTVVVVLSLAAAIIAVNIGGWPGILAAASIVLAFGATEAVGSVTNLQWPCAVALAVICATPSVRTISLPFAAIAGLSGPFVLFCAPLAAIRGWATREPRAIALAVIVVAAAAIQFIVLAANFETTANHAAAAPILIAKRVGLYAAGNTTSGAIGLAIFVASLFVGRLRGVRLGIAFVASLVILAVVAKFLHEPEVFSNDTAAPRYWYVPGALLLIGLVTTLAEPATRLRIMGGIGLLLILCGYFVHPFQYEAKEHFGSWSEAVSDGAVIYTYPPGWKIQIPRD